jgi:hypothetical protein
MDPVFSPSLSSDPNSYCTISDLAFSAVIGTTASLRSFVLPSPPNCSGIFNVFVANGPGGVTSNFMTVVVPPQALIRQMVGEAGIFGLSVDPNQLAQKSVGVAVENRFTLSGFYGYTNWEQFQDAGYTATSTTQNGPPVVIDNAALVYTGAVTGTLVGGAPCYWSPTYAQFQTVQGQFESQPASTILPSAVGRPQCYADSVAQIVWKTSMPNNIRTDASGAYLNAPAFLFIRLRNPGDLAIVQIQ